MERYYVVGYKNRSFKNCEHDYDIKEYTKREAKRRRLELQKLGYINVFIKLMKGQRALSDF